MNMDEAGKIFDCLSQHDDGCGIYTLAIETGLNPADLRKFIKLHRDFVVSRDDKRSFSVNIARGKMCTKELFLDSVRSYERRKHQNMLLYIVAIFTSIIFGMTNVISVLTQ